jgi:Domain of unknown function (DUF222)
MSSASLVESHDRHASPYALPRARRADTDALGETIAALAGRLHAATYELLVLLREFDERAGWNNGCLSCAHWLHWKTGIDLGAAREKVRVAKALPALPRISGAMQRGQISYGKVRALTRVATADNEASLLDLALAGNCSHVERVVRAWRRVDRVQAAQETAARHLQRQLSTWVDDDGMIVIRGRLTPEVGAVVQRAIEAAADQLFREAAHAPTGDAMAEELTPAQRRADALGVLAESALAANLDGGTAGDRYQVVLHVSPPESWDRTTESGVDQATAAPGGAAASDAFDGALEVDHGAVYVSMETSKRLACDASLVHMRHDADGVILDVSRKTRTIPPLIRRALAARDTSCRFPGCTSRRCDAHHVEHSTPARTPRAPGAPAGPMAAPRASTTSCCCADVITGPSTKADSVSSVDAMARSPSSGPMARPWRPPPPRREACQRSATPRPTSPGRLRAGTAPASTCRGRSTCSIAVSQFRRMNVRGPSERAVGQSSIAAAASRARARPVRGQCDVATV